MENSVEIMEISVTLGEAWVALVALVALAILPTTMNMDTTVWTISLHGCILLDPALVIELGDETLHDDLPPCMQEMRTRAITSTTGEDLRPL